MSYVLRGYSLVMGSPKLRKAIWVPMIWALILFLAVLIGGYLLVVPRLGAWLEGLGAPAALGSAASVALYGVAWFFLAGPVFVALTSTLSSFLWDGLSEEVERLHTGRVDRVKLGFGVVLFDTISRLALSLALALVALCLGPIAIVPLGLLGLFDYSAPAYLRRGFPLPEQRGRVFRAKSWLSFAFASGVVTLVPFVNILALPVLVAGGTLLCIETEDGMVAG